jgi:hypothetical protein
MKKITFHCPAFLSKARKKIVISMIDKQKTRHTENGEDFIVRYIANGEVRISITDTATGGKASWAITKAWIK